MVHRGVRMPQPSWETIDVKCYPSSLETTRREIR